MSEIRLIESVSRALDILELLDSEGELSNSKIAEKLGQEKSTVFRTLNTLKVRKYVRQDPETLKYSNGYKLFEMGHSVARRTGLPKLAYRFMRKLATTVNGAVNLGVLEGDKVVYIDKIESDETVKVCMKIGQGIPLHCTGLGKATLSYMNASAIRSIIGPGPYKRYTPNTITEFSELNEQLAQVRRDGYAIDTEEHIPGIICIAAPAFNARGEVIASLSVAFPNMNNSSEINYQAIGSAVYEAASGLTSSLGGQAPRGFI